MSEKTSANIIEQVPQEVVEFPYSHGDAVNPAGH